MKLFFTATLFILSSANAFADYASINCGSNSSNMTIQLTLDEISNVKVNTSTLLLNKKPTKISRLNVSQTEYGLLAVGVQVGNGPSKYNYSFKNLGSNKCFGVYGSNQKGSAYVEIINSLGLVGSLVCKCDQY